MEKSNVKYVVKEQKPQQLINGLHILLQQLLVLDLPVWFSFFVSQQDFSHDTLLIDILLFGITEVIVINNMKADNIVVMNFIMRIT